MVFLPPGGPTEIVFSFDTTGSMSAILDEVRGRLQDMIQRLQADLPGIKVSVIAHGDYCDAEHFYVTKYMDFSDNIKALCDFVDDVGGTGGGDVEECYELVLRQVRKQLSWQPKSQKILIVIGDAYPHEPDYPENTLNIDWREEIHDLTKMGVRIYGVQVGNDETSKLFFQTLASQGGGQYLKLEDFSNICTFIMAICYREHGDDFLMGYEAELRANKGHKSIGRDLEGLFGTLRRDDSKASSLGEPAALVVPPPQPVSPLPAGRLKPKKINKAVKLTVKPNTEIVTDKKCLKQTINRKTKNMRLHREKVPHTNFAFKNYRWSRWELALVASGEKTLKGMWSNLTFGAGRKRRDINLFKNSGKRSHVFVEVSVQATPHAKRHIVMFKVLNGNVSPSTWFRALFSKRKVRNEIKNVLNRGCRVYVRKSELKKTNKTMREECKYISNKYDYAWQHTGKCHRNVYLNKYDLYISSDSA